MATKENRVQQEPQARTAGNLTKQMLFAIMFAFGRRNAQRGVFHVWVLDCNDA